ncbi:hypothetical protein GCM10008939_19910 [Deinococcus aquiradiocola]|uniref:Transposase n=1 Tax=Deinococcus aquiradiocola TaxID=393059 RepID=A0A917UQK8_9DEIO|nr:hypothetical protein GCM10008939_19910 [Deinococcus aquiradiocola]
MEELCRDLGCSTASFSTWKKRYGDASVAEAKRLRQLERENDRLLNIVGQQRLEIEGMREVLAKKR